MHIELFISLVVHAHYLSYADELALAWTCRAAYRIVEPRVRAQVERVVKHLQSGQTAHPSDCLPRYVNLWSAMEVGMPRVRTCTALAPVTVLERSLLYAILSAWFDTYGGTIVDSKKTWICTADGDLLPTSLPNEDARCRFSHKGEYTVVIKTHVFTSEIMSLDCLKDQHPAPLINEQAWFEKNVISKVCKSVGKTCDVNQIMTTLGFYCIR